MRRRSTFIPGPGVDYDPSELKINGQHLSFAGLNAAREERLTFGLKDLPVELFNILNDSHELHIRWVSEETYPTSSPYLSSVTPGLHVHYTSRQAENLRSEKLCNILKDFFSTQFRCSTTGEAFSRPDILSSRFASTSSSQYYSLLPSLQQFVARIQRHFCSPSDAVCRHNAALLSIASYVDFDYDSVSHALTITAYWSKPPAVLMDPIGEWITYDHWNMALDALPNDRNEIGLLRDAGPTSEPAEIQMEGFLAVIGEDTAPKPTMFFFPSRHHRLSSKQSRAQRYSVAFHKPTGLHPTMSISFPSQSALKQPETKPSDSACALHAYLTLPSVLFVDEYAFPTTDLDPLFSEAHNIRMLRSLSGERDLEAPDYVIQKWGSALLLELETPSSDTADSDSRWDITIPLHFRYLRPTAGGTQTVDIPWPIVFWACTAEEGTKFTVNPFDRVNLGYDGLFGPRTMFYHLDPLVPNGTRLIEQVDVPVLDTDVISYSMAETMTTLLILVGFIWVAWKIFQDVLWELYWWSSSTGKKEKKNQ